MTTPETQETELTESIQLLDKAVKELELLYAEWQKEGGSEIKKLIG